MPSKFLIGKLEARALGIIPYGEAYEKQVDLHGRRVVGTIPDQLLLLQHPPVLTIPRRARPENVRVGMEQLERAGIDLLPTDRGGEVTLHNPGQLVGYLICRLDSGARDLHAFIRGIEDCLQEIAGAFGVRAESRKGLTGVWVEDRKLASIGIAVKRWVTLHGFALNVNNDLGQFDWIHPCGLRGVRMTSLSAERGAPVNWKNLLEATCSAFGAEPETGFSDWLKGSANLPSEGCFGDPQGRPDGFPSSAP